MWKQEFVSNSSQENVWKRGSTSNRRQMWENKAFSDIQQLLSAATDFKKYFEFLLQIYRIDVSLKGLWNDATIGFLYESLFSEKNINST